MPVCDKRYTIAENHSPRFQGRRYMRTWIRPTPAVAFVALTVCFAQSIPQSALAQAPPAADAGGGGNGWRWRAIPWLQIRQHIRCSCRRGSCGVLADPEGNDAAAEGRKSSCDDRAW